MSSFLVFVLFETLFQITQRLKAMAFVFANPTVVDLLQRHWIEEMQFLASAPDRGDEVRLFEENQVLGHRLPGHLQMLTQLRQRLTIVRVQLIQQLAATRIG